MKCLVDTNVISETIKRQPNDGVISWIARQPIDDTAISIVTLAEIRDGIESAPDTTRHELLRWLERDIEPRFANCVFQLTAEILVDWFRLSRALSAERMMRRAADLLLASTARVHGFVLVTRNVRHFANTGVVVYDPWTGTTHVMDVP